MLRGAVFVCLITSLCVGFALAQPGASPGSPGQAEGTSPTQIGPGVKHNIVSIEKVMREIHQLMHQGVFTPQQDTEISEMMTRLGIMMHEMSGPQREKLAKQHEQELQAIRRRLEIIKQQLKKNN